MLDIKLSIIIPNYNSADQLIKLLSTIPSTMDIQTIVVDDHSNSKLMEWEECKQKYKDSNVEFYVNECGKSAGGARNTGLKYAKGDWIMFADADDYFVPDFYEYVQKFFDKEYDLVYFRSTSIDLETGKISDRHEGAELLIRNYLENPNKKNEVRLKYNYFSPCAKLVRKELFDRFNIRFDEVMVANDVMCSLKLAFHANSIFVVDEIIYCITKQPGTLTTLITEERYDARMDVFYRRHSYLKEHLSKNEYKLLHFNARLRLKQVLQYKFGWKKYFEVLGKMLCERVPIWREISPSYYYETIRYMIREKKTVQDNGNH